MVKRKVTGKSFQIFYAQGNQVAGVVCRDITYPTQNDFFMTMRGIEFPIEDMDVEAMYLPKHLIMMIKEREIDKPNKSNLVVLHGSDR